MMQSQLLGQANQQTQWVSTAGSWPGAVLGIVDCCRLATGPGPGQQYTKPERPQTTLAAAAAADAAAMAWVGAVWPESQKE